MMTMRLSNKRVKDLQTLENQLKVEKAKIQEIPLKLLPSER